MTDKLDHMKDDLLVRLGTMYSHRGDGIPTQYVNPDGPEAADEITRLRAKLVNVKENCASIADKYEADALAKADRPQAAHIVADYESDADTAADIAKAIRALD